MRRAVAKRMFEAARDYVGDDVFDPPNFERDVNQRRFLEQYLWTIYVSGFAYDVLKEKFGKIKRHFHNLNLKRIANMRRVNAKSLPIRNQRKADAFHKGCRSHNAHHVCIEVSGSE